VSDRQTKLTVATESFTHTTAIHHTPDNTGSTVQSVAYTFCCVEMTVGYLKLDVTSDGAWSAIDDALRSRALDHVQQLGMLVHVTSGRQQRHLATRQWTVLLELERAGFRRWFAAPVTTTDGRTSRLVRRKLPTDIALYQLVYINARFFV